MAGGVLVMFPNRPSGRDFLQSFLNPLDSRYDNGLTFIARNRLPINQVYHILAQEKHIRADVKCSYAYIAFREYKGHFPKQVSKLIKQSDRKQVEDILKQMSLN